MTIDWQKEVDARKEDLLADLFTLLSIPSEREDDKATEEAPVGPGPKAALLKFLEIGQRDGFITKNVDNLAGHIEYGSGDETLGVFGHVDVVPAGSGWDSDPYKPEIRDGRIYARGASDDKGPSMAAYYGLKIIKELGLPLSKRIRFILGTDEESGWMCMDHYLAVEETPDFGFSPDAEFPIINGEKGNVTIGLHFRGDNAGDYTLESFASGLRINMVPEDAKAEVTTKTPEEAAAIEKAFYDFVGENPVTGTCQVEGTKVNLIIVGKSAHGAMPEKGINAGTYLATFLDQFKFGGSAKKFLHTAMKYVHQDTTGEKLGVAHTDPLMGALSMNAGLLVFKAGDGSQAENFIALNFRYPQGVTAEGLEIKIESKVGMDGVVVMSSGHGHTPHYVPADDPLVKTLLEVYEEHTGLEGHEQVIGGGTFGRLLERGVAYGAMFPDSIDTMHQANEFMSVKDLINSAVIYADAIYRLAK